MDAGRKEELLLLVDACGERASVALCRNDLVLGESELAERTASAGLLGAIRGLLSSSGLPLSALTGIGVVNGPGSFTGLRVGLSLAKGLCEALGLPLAAVSRLAVLADASGLVQGSCILRAGPKELYVRRVQRDQPGHEVLMSATAFAASLGGSEIVYAERSLDPLLESFAIPAHWMELRAAHALRLVRASLQADESVVAGVDANYVRDEEAIYAAGRKTG